MGKWSGEDERHMRRALELAERGRGTTSPNPMVGCVIVAGGRVVGEGWHERAGGPHAEVVALQQAGEAARGATVYVTLEPCARYGRTPPCTGALIKAGVARVICALRDPTESGGGLEELARAGVEVAHGLLERRARRQNEAWLKWSASGLPFVTLKLAATLDGQIAARGRGGEKVSGKAAHERVHALRAASDAVLVGVGTVLADDPRLTARPREGEVKRQPLRVVLDSALRTPPEARVADVSLAPTVIFAGPEHDPKNRERLSAQGVEIVEVGRGEQGVDLGAVLAELGRREVLSLLVEGGSAVATSFVREGLADKLVLYLAPKLLGSARGVPIVGDLGIDQIAAAVALAEVSVQRCGEDVEVVAYFEREACSRAS